MPVERPMRAETSPLFRILGAVDHVLCSIENATMFAAGLSLSTMMLLIFFDATFRYSLNSPLTITSDMVVLYLLSSSMLLVLSYTLRRGGHIGVELFAVLIPKRLYHLLIGVSLLACVIIIGVMAAEGVEYAWESWRQNELMIGIWPWPIWLSKMIVAFAFVLLEIRILHIGVTYMLAFFMNNPAIAVPIAVELEEEGL